MHDILQYKRESREDLKPRESRVDKEKKRIYGGEIGPKKGPAGRALSLIDCQFLQEDVAARVPEFTLGNNTTIKLG